MHVLFFWALLQSGGSKCMVRETYESVCRVVFVLPLGGRKLTSGELPFIFS